MKKIIHLTFLGIGLIALQAQAQHPQIGITVGINGASVSPTAIDQFREAEVKPGLYAGVFMQVPLGKSFALQPEVMYSAAGFTEPYDPADYVENFTYHFNYLSVPVLVKYRLNRFAIGIGPQLNYLLSAQKKVENGDFRASSDFKPYLKSVDYGGLFSLNYRARFGLGFDVRYYVGLSNLKTAGNTDFSAHDTYHSNIFQIGLSYLFGPKF